MFDCSLCEMCIRDRVRTLLRDRTYTQEKVQIVHENVEEFENFLETPLKKSLVLFNGGWGSEL